MASNITNTNAYYYPPEAANDRHLLTKYLVSDIVSKYERDHTGYYYKVKLEDFEGEYWVRGSYLKGCYNMRRECNQKMDHLWKVIDKADQRKFKRQETLKFKFELKNQADIRNWPKKESSQPDRVVVTFIGKINDQSNPLSVVEGPAEQGPPNEKILVKEEQPNVAGPVMANTSARINEMPVLNNGVKLVAQTNPTFEQTDHLSFADESVLIISPPSSTNISNLSAQINRIVSEQRQHLVDKSLLKKSEQTHQKLPGPAVLTDVNKLNEQINGIASEQVQQLADKASSKQQEQLSQAAHPVVLTDLSNSNGQINEVIIGSSDKARASKPMSHEPIVRLILQMQQETQQRQQQIFMDHQLKVDRENQRFYKEILTHIITNETSDKQVTNEKRKIDDNGIQEMLNEYSKRQKI